MFGCPLITSGDSQVKQWNKANTLSASAHRTMKSRCKYFITTLRILSIMEKKTLKVKALFFFFSFFLLNYVSWQQKHTAVHLWCSTNYKYHDLSKYNQVSNLKPFNCMPNVIPGLVCRAIWFGVWECNYVSVKRVKWSHASLRVLGCTRARKETFRTDPTPGPFITLHTALHNNSMTLPASAI